MTDVKRAAKCLIKVVKTQPPANGVRAVLGRQAVRQALPTPSSPELLLLVVACLLLHIRVIAHTHTSYESDANQPIDAADAIGIIGRSVHEH